jgi:hypothetical protein
MEPGYIITFMENQNQQPVTPAPPTITPPVVPPQPTVPSVNQQQKPTGIQTNGEAQALLAIQNLQASQQTSKSKLPMKLIIACSALIVLLILTSYLLGAVKSKGSGSGSSVGLPNQSPTTSGNSTSNQINQDVKTCSNVVNAATVC